MSSIGLIDYLVLLFQLPLIYFFAYNIRNRHYPVGHPWRPYFISGLTVKIVGALFIGLVYEYYYTQGGDTTWYYRQAKVINSAFSDSPIKWINLVLHIPDWYDPGYQEYMSDLFWYEAPQNYTVSVFAAVLGIFTFTTYLPTAALFAVLSFSGTWAMFRTFAKISPIHIRQLAIAILFIPSTFVWGSGIFKDTLCMFGLGWVIYGAYIVLLQRKFSIKNVILLLSGMYLISIIKMYILVAFIPALVTWALFNYSQRFGNKTKRRTVRVALVSLAFLFVFTVTTFFKAELGQYSLDNMINTSETTRGYIQRTTDETGSSYDLGRVEFSVGSLALLIPQAINVSLFRPYLWEAKKPIIFFNALEAFMFIIITVRVLWSVGPRGVYRAVSSSPVIQFCLMFSLMFAFAVGISTYNFGSLSRYRIPALPIYLNALIFIYYSAKSNDEKVFIFR